MKLLQPQMIEIFEQTAQFIFVPTNEEEYTQLVSLLDEMSDVVRDDEAHPLANLMEVLGRLIEMYDDEHIPEPAPDPIAILKHFMTEYQLTPNNLLELGQPQVVSEILSGQQELTLPQIKTLSRRFNVPTSLFV